MTRCSCYLCHQARYISVVNCHIGISLLLSRHLRPNIIDFCALYSYNCENITCRDVLADEEHLSGTRYIRDTFVTFCYWRHNFLDTFSLWRHNTRVYYSLNTITPLAYCIDRTRTSTKRIICDIFHLDTITRRAMLYRGHHNTAGHVISRTP